MHPIRYVKDVIREPYAWPGGYEKHLVTADGGVICKDCVKAEYRTIALNTVAGDTESGWCAAGIDVNYETLSLICDHCGRTIEAEYAPFREGDRVEAIDATDYHTGMVRSVFNDCDGNTSIDYAIVAWDSGITTPTPCDLIRLRVAS